MRRVRATLFATAIAALALPGDAATPLPLPSVVQVIGNVTNAARPVGNALVIALNLSNLEASQTFTSIDGTFNLPQLPAGIYKIIAVKYGFAPAMAMLVPTRNEHRIKLRLEPEGQTRRNVSQEMWEIRGSVPPAILREIDAVMAPPVTMSASTEYSVPRFRGEMMSMTGVAAQTSAPAFAQTALGVQSRISDNWQIGFHGNLHRVEDPTDDRSFGSPVAQSSVMEMELRSSPTDAYRVASTKSWWRYTPGELPADQQQADIRSHNFEWEHDDTRVQVRYLGQQNLFAATPGSDLIEIAGNTTLMQTRRSGVGVALRVTQESLRNTANGTFRTADLTANATFEVAPAFTVNYGMSSRLGLYGTEWAPRSGAQVKLGKNTAFVVSGMYKVYDQERPNVLPSVVVWSDDSRMLPRYAYSFGIVSSAGEESTDRFSAIASISAADSPMRVIFNDGFEHFWDGLYIDTGDVRRDVRLAYRKELGKRVLVNVSSSAGMAAPRLQMYPNREKNYVTGDIESTYFPTRTTLALSYRQIHQPQPAGIGADFRTERVDVRLAQALHLLLDFKVLMGVQVARAANSPILLDTLEPDGTTRRYIGGLALNF
jgi:Carboxypeptidase regulatory-like domain